MGSMRQLIINKEFKVQTISIILSVIIFLVSTFIGFSIDLGFENEAFTASAKGIFLNNLSVCFTLIVGLLSFGLVSFIVLVINGVYLGSAMKFYITNNSLEQMLLVFVPHAIFEIPAILLSASIGFFLLLFVIEKGNGRKQVALKGYLLYSLKSIVFVIILLGIAAIIESYVSIDMSKNI